jgi:hypothetical protein
MNMKEAKKTGQNLQNRKGVGVGRRCERKANQSLRYPMFVPVPLILLHAPKSVISLRLSIPDSFNRPPHFVVSTDQEKKKKLHSTYQTRKDHFVRPVHLKGIQKN